MILVETKQPKQRVLNCSFCRESEVTIVGAAKKTNNSTIKLMDFEFWGCSCNLFCFGYVFG